jgi:hypothetical protein
MNKSLNVVKIVRSLRDLKILMNNSLLNDELRKYLRHAEKNLIDLESDSDDDENRLKITDNSDGDEGIEMQNHEAAGCSIQTTPRKKPNESFAFTPDAIMKNITKDIVTRPRAL